MCTRRGHYIYLGLRAYYYYHTKSALLHCAAAKPPLLVKSVAGLVVGSWRLALLSVLVLRAS